MIITNLDSNHGIIEIAEDSLFFFRSARWNKRTIRSIHSLTYHPSRGFKLISNYPHVRDISYNFNMIKHIFKNVYNRQQVTEILTEFSFRNGGRIDMNKTDWGMSSLLYPHSNGIFENKEDIHPHIARHFRKGGLRYAVEKITGSKSTKLYKNICEKVDEDYCFPEERILVRCLMLKDLVTIDHYQEIITHGKFDRFRDAVDTTDCDHIKKCQNLLKNYSSQRLFKLFTDGSNHHEDDPSYLTDAVKMYDEYPEITLPRKPKSFYEIHEQLSDITRKIKKEYKELDVDSSLNGVKLEDYTIRIPKSNHELIDWSTEMNNCIHSYFDQALRKEVVLLALMDGSKMKYNVMLRNGKIEQFYGKSNSYVEPSEYEKLSEGILSLIN